MSHKLPRVPEKIVQIQIVKLLRSIGAAVYVSGTTRRRGDFHGTMQTPGIPDLEAFLSANVKSPARLLKIECKASGGRLRAPQAQYRDQCAAAGVAHVVGDLDAVIAWLVAEGYVTASAFPHYRQPQETR